MPAELLLALMGHLALGPNTQVIQTAFAMELNRYGLLCYGCLLNASGIRDTTAVCLCCDLPAVIAMTQAKARMGT